jgi:hypothetical protein
MSGKVCAVCGVEGRLQRCARCQKVFYCGREHQSAHWRDHKSVCQAPSKEGTVLALFPEGEELLRLSTSPEVTSLVLSSPLIQGRLLWPSEQRFAHLERLQLDRFALGCIQLDQETFPSLTHLQLSHASDLVLDLALPQLRSLRMDHCELRKGVRKNVFGESLSKCLLLEEVLGDSISGLESMNLFLLPSLKRFSLRRLSECHMIEIWWAPKLEKIDLSYATCLNHIRVWNRPKVTLNDLREIESAGEHFRLKANALTPDFSEGSEYLLYLREFSRERIDAINRISQSCEHLVEESLPLCAIDLTHVGFAVEDDPEDTIAHLLGEERLEITGKDASGQPMKNVLTMLLLESNPSLLPPSVSLEHLQTLSKAHKNLQSR